MVEKVFKQIEIGLIPEDWEVLSIEELCVSGGIVRGPFGGSLKKSFFVPSGYKVYEQKNAIYSNVNIGNYYISFEKFNELRRFEVKEGDFIISCSGTIGRIFQIPQKFEKGIINQALLKLTINRAKYSDIFFLHYFKWNNFQKIIIDNTQGGAMQNLIGMSDFKKTIIPFPPTKPEQEAIAKVLSDTDTLIEKLEQLIAKKRNIKTATMQQLLKPKEGWEVKKLGEIFSILKGKGLSKSVINEYGSYQCILYGELFTTYKEIIDEIKSRTNTYEGIKSEKGDILFPGSTTTIGIDLAKSSVLMVRDVLLGGDIIILRRKSNVILPEYAVYYINVERKKQIAEKTKGITIYHLHGKDLYDIEIQYPSISEQTRIAQILSDMDNEIEALEKKLNKYKMLKQGLMQVLLTGKIRLV